MLRIKIRLFTLNIFGFPGEFLFKFGYEGPSGKLLDSPRGVAFLNDRTVLVTDFNMHKLSVVDLTLNGRPSVSVIAGLSG